MDRDRIRLLLEGVKLGEIPVDSAMKSLASFPFVDTKSARVDIQRSSGDKSFLRQRKTCGQKTNACS